MLHCVFSDLSKCVVELIRMNLHESLARPVLDVSYTKFSRGRTLDFICKKFSRSRALDFSMKVVLLDWVYRIVVDGWGGSG